MAIEVCEACGEPLCRHDHCECGGACDECRLERETMFMEEEPYAC